MSVFLYHCHCIPAFSRVPDIMSEQHWVIWIISTEPSKASKIPFSLGKIWTNRNIHLFLTALPLSISPQPPLSYLSFLLKVYYHLPTHFCKFSKYIKLVSPHDSSRLSVYGSLTLYLLPSCPHLATPYLSPDPSTSGISPPLGKKILKSLTVRSIRIFGLIDICPPDSPRRFSSHTHRPRNSESGSRLRGL